MEKTAGAIKPYSKINELLGLPQPEEKDIYVTSKGVTVVREGILNIEKLIKKALSL
ncbi:hypothetical protein HMPREF1013_04860 [Bacillus sp. 2_A_57_CT2]|nr:hypothetical protein HMPREF1013_04860 [Bacillus sp. 2_A_57_CT2]